MPQGEGTWLGWLLEMVLSFLPQASFRNDKTVHIFDQGKVGLD